jgi:hypothetical protein
MASWWSTVENAGLRHDRAGRPVRLYPPPIAEPPNCATPPVSPVGSVGATSSVDGINSGFDFILFHVGSVVGLMEYGDIGQPDIDQIQGFATEAVDKIEGKTTATSTSE